MSECISSGLLIPTDTPDGTPIRMDIFPMPPLQLRQVDSVQVTQLEKAMWKLLGLLAAGLAAGTAAVIHTQDKPASATLLVSGTTPESVDVQKSLAALDRRVRDLTTQVQALRDAAGSAPAGDAAAEAGDERGPGRRGFREPRSAEEMAAMREQMQKRDAERIAAAGLTPERMQALNRRAAELRVAAMQAQYEAQRNGQRAQGVDVDQMLRKELGDAEYERYLKAQGRGTEVRVMEVLATSAAERAGIQAGDEIVSYGGTRVFDNRDLNTLSNQASPGGTVVIQLKRDGQTVQVSVPSGPLGVTAPGGPGGGGPPGGGAGFPGGGRGAGAFGP